MDIKDLQEFYICNYENKFWGLGSTVVPSTALNIDEEFLNISNILKSPELQENFEVYWLEQGITGEVKLPGEWNYCYYKGKYYHLQKTKSDGYFLNGGEKCEFFFYTVIYDDWANEFLTNNVYVRGTINKTGDRKKVAENLNLVKPIVTQGNDRIDINGERVENGRDQSFGYRVLTPPYDEYKWVWPLINKGVFIDDTHWKQTRTLISKVKRKGFWENLKEQFTEFLKKPLFVYDVDTTKIRVEDFNRTFNHTGQYYAVSDNEDKSYIICKTINKAIELKEIVINDWSIQQLNENYTLHVGNDPKYLYTIDKLLADKKYPDGNYGAGEYPLLSISDQLLTEKTYPYQTLISDLNTNTKPQDISKYFQNLDLSGWQLGNRVYSIEDLEKTAWYDLAKPYSFVGHKDFIDNGWIDLTKNDKNFGWFLGFDPIEVTDPDNKTLYGDVTFISFINSLKTDKDWTNKFNRIQLKKTAKNITFEGKTKTLSKPALDISNILSWTNISKQRTQLWFGNLLSNIDFALSFDDIKIDPYFSSNGAYIDAKNGIFRSVKNLFKEGVDFSKTWLDLAGEKYGLAFSYYGYEWYKLNTSSTENNRVIPSEQALNYFSPVFKNGTHISGLDVLKSACYLDEVHVFYNSTDSAGYSKTYFIYDKYKKHPVSTLAGTTTTESKLNTDANVNYYNAKNFFPKEKDILEWNLFLNSVAKTEPSFDAMQDFLQYYDWGFFTSAIYNPYDETSILYDLFSYDRSKYEIKFKDENKTNLKNFLNEKYKLTEQPYTELSKLLADKIYIFQINNFVVYSKIINDKWHFELLIKDNYQTVRNVRCAKYILKNKVNETNDPNALIKAVNSFNELNIYGNPVPIRDRFLLDGTDIDWGLYLSNLKDKYQSDSNFFLVEMNSPETKLMTTIETPKEATFATMQISAHERRDMLLTYVNNQQNRFFERRNLEIEKNKFHEDKEREMQYYGYKEGGQMSSDIVTAGSIAGTTAMGVAIGGGIGGPFGAVAGAVLGGAIGLIGLGLKAIFGSYETEEQQKERITRLKYGAESFDNRTAQLNAQHAEAERQDRYKIQNMSNANIYNNTTQAVNYQGFNELNDLSDIHLTQYRPKGALLEELKHYYDEYGFDVVLTKQITHGISDIDGHIRFQTITESRHENNTIKAMIEARLLNGVKIVTLEGEPFRLDDSHYHAAKTAIDRYHDLKNDYDQLQLAKEKIEAELALAKSELDPIKAEKAKCESDLTALQNEKDKVGKELDAHLRALNDCKQTGTQLENQIAEHLKKIDKLESDKNTVTAIKEALEKELDKAKKDRDDATERLNILITEKSKVDSDLAEKNKKVNELTNKVNEQKQKCEEDEQKHNDAIRNVLQQKTQVETKLKTAQDEVEELKKAQSQLQNEKVQKENDLNDCQEKLKEKDDQTAEITKACPIIQKIANTQKEFYIENFKLFCKLVAMNLAWIRKSDIDQHLMKYPDFQELLKLIQQLEAVPIIDELIDLINKDPKKIQLSDMDSYDWNDYKIYNAHAIKHIMSEIFYRSYKLSQNNRNVLETDLNLSHFLKHYFPGTLEGYYNPTFNTEVKIEILKRDFNCARLGESKNAIDWLNAEYEKVGYDLDHLTKAPTPRPPTAPILRDGTKLDGRWKPFWNNESKADLCKYWFNISKTGYVVDNKNWTWGEWTWTLDPSKTKAKTYMRTSLRNTDAIYNARNKLWKKRDEIELDDSLNLLLETKKLSKGVRLENYFGEYDERTGYAKQGSYKVSSIENLTDLFTKEEAIIALKLMCIMDAIQLWPSIKTLSDGYLAWDHHFRTLADNPQGPIKEWGLKGIGVGKSAKFGTYITKGQFVLKNEFATHIDFWNYIYYHVKNKPNDLWDSYKNNATDSVNTYNGLIKILAQSDSSLQKA